MWTSSCLVPIRLWCSPWEQAQDFLKAEQRLHHNVWCTSYRATPHRVTSVTSHFLSRACPLLHIHCLALGYCVMCPYLVKEMNKDTLNEIATCICVMFNGRRAVVLDSNSLPHCTISTYSSPLVTCDHHKEISTSSAPEIRCDILYISSADFWGTNSWCAAGTKNFCPSLRSPLWPVTNHPSLLFEGRCDLWPKSWSKWYSILHISIGCLPK